MITELDQTNVKHSILHNTCVVLKISFPWFLLEVLPLIQIGYGLQDSL